MLYVVKVAIVAISPKFWLLSVKTSSFSLETSSVSVSTVSKVKGSFKGREAKTLVYISC